MCLITELRGCKGGLQQSHCGAALRGQRRVSLGISSTTSGCLRERAFVFEPASNAGLNVPLENAENILGLRPDRTCNCYATSSTIEWRNRACHTQVTQAKCGCAQVHRLARQALQRGHCDDQGSTGVLIVRWQFAVCSNNLAGSNLRSFSRALLRLRGATTTTLLLARRWSPAPQPQQITKTDAATAIYEFCHL